MYKLQLNCSTWQRPDANQLFDYQLLEALQNQKKIVVDQSGYIYRNKQTYELSFVPALSDKKKNGSKLQKLQKILKIIKKDCHYFIQSCQQSKQPLCKIITNQPSGIYQIKQNDLLRLGKIQIQVLKLKFNNKKYKNRYEQLKHQVQKSQISQITQITPSFYDKGIQQSQSLIADNPTCRYCHCKSINQDNHFLISCKCKGYTRYVHEECLVEWILKRGSLHEIKNKGIYYIEAKLFKCELCNQFFDVNSLFQKIYKYHSELEQSVLEKEKQEGQEKKTKQIEEIMILHFKSQINFLFFIDLGKSTQICIGRSLQSDIILYELSVSRKHAFLKIDNENKITIIKDNESKFGTLVQIKKTEIQNNETFQVGRSKIVFSKHKQKSFFQYFGFCMTEEKLRKEKKKNVEMREEKKGGIKQQLVGDKD